MTCDSQDRLIELNALFKEHDDTIAKLQQQLKEQLSQTLSPSDLAHALCYCQDRVTIFRHLVETNFDTEKAYQQLYDTAHWRITHHVDQLGWRALPEWFEKGFAFYHKYDRSGQPVLVIRLRHFPVDFIRQQQQQQQQRGGDSSNKTTTLAYLLQPFVCYMLEMARRLTYDDTCRNERRQQRQQQSGDGADTYDDGPMVLPLVVQVNVVIDLIDAPYIPIDASLVEILSPLIQVRFPFMVGSISVLNFSWLHQGLWQVLKLLLSDDTKARITFVTKDHLLQSIPKENLLQELGGSDDGRWNSHFNKVLQNFDTMLQHDMLPPSPPSSTTMELPEIGTLFDCDDDATTTTDDMDLQNKVEEEEENLNNNNGNDDDNDNRNSTTQYSLGSFGVTMQRRQLGLRMGYPFLSSYVLDQLAALDSSGKNNNNKTLSDKEYEANQVMVTSSMVVENTHHGTRKDGSTQTLSDDSNDDYERQLHFFLLLGKSLCWLLFYLFLRIPMESLIYRHLAPLINPQHVLATTIGLAAGMAMVTNTLIQVVVDL